MAWQDGYEREFRLGNLTNDLVPVVLSVAVVNAELDVVV